MLPIIITVSLISLVVGSFATWIYLKHQVSVKGCPFGHACLSYDPLATKEAAKRVSTLLLTNLDDDVAYKKAVRTFLDELDQKEE